MGTRIKTKLTFGLLFLFIVILAFGGLGIFYVNRLSSDAGMILKDNHISLEYCNHLLKALDNLAEDSTAIAVFENNLRLEENNITEPGEQEATNEVRSLFESLKKDPGSFAAYKEMRRAILKIEDVNQIAIIHKNVVATNTAFQATFWLTAIVTILSIAAFTFVLNFPSILARPIQVLSEGIGQIAARNYSKRIYLDQKDEFRSLADAFNTMAEKLDEYEHSNLAEIKFEKSRIEAIINKMKDGIAGFDDKQHFLFVNNAAEQLFGLREADVIGKYAPDIALSNDLLRTVLQNDPRKALKIYADGKESFFTQETIPIQVGEGPVTNGEQGTIDGQVKNREQVTIGGQVIILRNITPFRELDAAKTNFIATISHELKTPIFAIKIGSQLLEDKRVGTLNDDQAEILNSIKNNSERLLNITGELLNITQVETGKIELKMQPSRSETIALRAMQAVQQQAAQVNVSLKQKIATGLPLVNADEEKTTWVLINLLTNAIKYSPEGGHVEVRIKKEHDQVQFLVTDHGRGIEEKYLPHVFEKYFKVPGAFGKSGTGLGLSISKEFIQAQGGEIWAESVYGEGSTFAFSVPAASERNL